MEIHLQTTDHVVAVEKVAEQHIGTKLCSCNTYEDISHLLIMVIIQIDKVAITHLAMEIHFQTTDHVVAVEKVAEQHIRTKYCKCNSFRVISHIIILAKIAITHSKVGQSSPNPKNIEEQKNSLGLVIYQKCVVMCSKSVVVSEKTA